MRILITGHQGYIGSVMTPYLAALAVLAGIGRGARLPAAIGTAFARNRL